MSFHTLTAIALATIDLRHHLTDLEVEPEPVGIALFSGRVDAGTIHFDLQAGILEPTEPGERLLTWLDEHIPPEGATIAGFEIGAGMVPMLRNLSNSRTSLGIKVLAGLRDRRLIDMHGLGDGPRRTRFSAVCGLLQVPVDGRDADERFLDWSFGRQDRAVHGISVDVIATWRMSLAMIGARSSLGAAVAGTAEDQLQDWLAAADSSAAMIHRAPPGR